MREARPAAARTARRPAISSQAVYRERLLRSPTFIHRLSVTRCVHCGVALRPWARRVPSRLSGAGLGRRLFRRRAHANQPMGPCIGVPDAQLPGRETVEVGLLPGSAAVRSHLPDMHASARISLPA
jgi:hypothetical protein